MQAGSQSKPVCMLVWHVAGSAGSYAMYGNTQSAWFLAVLPQHAGIELASFSAPPASANTVCLSLGHPLLSPALGTVTLGRQAIPISCAWLPKILYPRRLGSKVELK